MKSHHPCVEEGGKCCGGKCHSKDEKVSVMFCPSCKSFNVGYTFGLKNIFGVIPKTVCRDCSFSAPSFPVLETTKKNISRHRRPKK